MKLAPYLGIVAFSISPLAAGEPIDIEVTPSYAFAPANLTIAAIIEPDADNRALEIVADSSMFYRSSRVLLDGDRAASRTVVEFRNLPSGRYEVRAILSGSRGIRETVAQQVTIIDRGATR